MRSKFYLVSIFLLLGTILSCYANTEYTMRIKNGNFFIDDTYYFSIGDDTIAAIKCFGQPDYIDENPAGYGYFYSKYNLCIDIDFKNKISGVFLYLMDYPFESENVVVKKIVIDNLEYNKGYSLEKIKNYLDQKNIQYYITDYKIYPVLTVYDDSFERKEKYYLRFTKKENGLYLETIQY